MSRLTKQPRRGKQEEAAKKVFLFPFHGERLNTKLRNMPQTIGQTNGKGIPNINAQNYNMPQQQK